ncbi:MAG TPA: mechanosensitive ion channel family protein [Oligoflexia bacterium]|nr:mechanosensitive ion channel family protein [Oligoflexia bacterium]HMP27884.1 mechanosensitive ion channel family protein [Oligoflexia bacterium]
MFEKIIDSFEKVGVIKPSLAVLAGLIVAVLLVQGKRFLVRFFSIDKDLFGVNRAVAAAFESTSSLLITLFALATALRIAELPFVSIELIDNLLSVIVVLQIALWFSRFLKFSINKYFANYSDNGRATAVSIINFLAHGALWSLAVLVILDNLGINVTALVAGLGVGGVAVALAVQNILSDLFSSLSIVMDKPFEVGDFIIIDDIMGNVERVGIKTTRLRSLSGEQIVLANTDLLKSRIKNFKRMFERRVTFSLSVVYGTPLKKLEQIPVWIEEIIKGRDLVRFDRAHFRDFLDSGLKIEVTYFVQSSDMKLYLDRQQEINIAIIKKFKEEGVEFAFPTRVLYLQDERAVGDGFDKIN